MCTFVGRPTLSKLHGNLAISKIQLGLILSKIFFELKVAPLNNLASTGKSSMVQGRIITPSLLHFHDFQIRPIII